MKHWLFTYWYFTFFFTFTFHLHDYSQYTGYKLKARHKTVELCLHVPYSTCHF